MADAPLGPNFDLTGKTALITGAGRGIGLGAAQALANAGAKVMMLARTTAEISEHAEKLKDAGHQAGFEAMDILDVDKVVSFIAQTGPYDILVNNAGTNIPQRFLDVTTETFDTIIDLNVRAAFFVAQAVARGLLEAERPGSIINMSSQMGHVGGRQRTVYCASKHAMEGFTKAMAIELGPHQVRVNTVCPTFIETPLTKPFFEDQTFRDDVLDKIVLGRVGQVNDVSGAVVFLASNASAMITGSSVKGDGGWTAA